MKKNNALISVLAITFCLIQINLYATNYSYYLTVTLLDGSIYKGFSDRESVRFKNPLGELKIPLSVVQRLEFSPKLDSGLIAFIEKKFDSRVIDSTIYNQLFQKYGIKVLFAGNETIESSPDPNLSLTTYNDQLKEIYPDAGSISFVNDGEDIITGSGFTSLTGTIDFACLHLYTPYDTLTINRSDIASIDIYYRKPDLSQVLVNGSYNFTLEANKNVFGNKDLKVNWLNTHIKLSENQNFSISASGKVILKSISDNIPRYPDGTVNGQKQNASYSLPLTYGTLVYRIGESDYSPKKAGSSFKGRADNSGILYLSIYETIFDPKNTGSYNVTVKVN